MLAPRACFYHQCQVLRLERTIEKSSESRGENRRMTSCFSAAASSPSEFAATVASCLLLALLLAPPSLRPAAGLLQVPEPARQALIFSHRPELALSRFHDGRSCCDFWATSSGGGSSPQVGAMVQCAMECGAASAVTRELWSATARGSHFFVIAAAAAVLQC